MTTFSKEDIILNYKKQITEAKKEANRVYRLARRASADFDALALEYSDGPTRTRGGDLGFFQEGEMATEFFNFVNIIKKHIFH